MEYAMDSNVCCVCFSKKNLICLFGGVNVTYRKYIRTLLECILNLKILPESSSNRICIQCCQSVIRRFCLQYKKLTKYWNKGDLQLLEEIPNLVAWIEKKTHLRKTKLVHKVGLNINVHFESKFKTDEMPEKSKKVYFKKKYCNSFFQGKNSSSFKSYKNIPEKNDKNMTFSFFETPPKSEFKFEQKKSAEKASKMEEENSQIDHCLNNSEDINCSRKTDSNKTVLNKITKAVTETEVNVVEARNIISHKRCDKSIFNTKINQNEEVIPDLTNDCTSDGKAKDTALSSGTSNAPNTQSITKNNQDDKQEKVKFSHSDTLMSIKTNKTRTVFTCSYCEQIFISKKLLIKHKRVHLFCKFCKQKFSSENSMDDHILCCPIKHCLTTKPKVRLENIALSNKFKTLFDNSTVDKHIKQIKVESSTENYDIDHLLNRGMVMSTNIKNEPIDNIENATNNLAINIDDLHAEIDIKPDTSLEINDAFNVNERNEVVTESDPPNEIFIRPTSQPNLALFQKISPRICYCQWLGLGFR